MYVPAHFAMSDPEAAAMLAAVTAADLITPAPDGLIATFLPLEYDAAAHVLRGHVARNNPHWQAAAQGDDSSAAESLVIVRGPDAYVSPSAYESKREHGRVVPTWNYVTLHVYGRLVAHDDPEWLRGLVTRLTERHESGFERPWAVADAPPAFIDGQLRAIVGLELRISRVVGKAKLSQNRSAADVAGVIVHLEGTSSEVPAAAAVAAAMQQRPER